MSQVILARFYVLWMTYLTKLNHISTAPRKKQISICPCSQQPKVDTTQMSLIRQLDKQNVVYTHRGILFSLEKEVKGNSDSCSDVDEPWGHCAEWNQRHKGLVLCDVAERPQDSQLHGDNAGQRSLWDTVMAKQGVTVWWVQSFQMGWWKTSGYGQWWEPQDCEYA